MPFPNQRCQTLTMLNKICKNPTKYKSISFCFRICIRLSFLEESEMKTYEFSSGILTLIHGYFDYYITLPLSPHHCSHPSRLVVPSSNYFPKFFSEYHTVCCQSSTERNTTEPSMLEIAQIAWHLFTASFNAIS